MSTTGFISSAFGGDIGDTFYPNPDTSSYTPPANTNFISGGTDLSQQFLSIKYAPGTSTLSGFKANGTDLSNIFATSAPLSIKITNGDGACSYETTEHETCCPPGGGGISAYVTATGGYSSSYTYSWTISSQSPEFSVHGGTTSASLIFSFPCLPAGTYGAHGTVVVTDANNNQVSGDWYVKMVVTAIS